MSSNAAVRINEPRTNPAPEGVDEEVLLARCQLGDRAAIRALFDRHARIVMANARRLGLPSGDVDDVVQEVFTVAFKDLARIQPGSLGAYLFRLTSNRVHDRFRRRRVREAFARWFGASEPIEDHDGPERAMMRQDAERRVGRILANMSQKKREVFALFELQGASGEEIAEQLQIPVDTVWTRLHHARLEFAKAAKNLELFEESRTRVGAPAR